MISYNEQEDFTHSQRLLKYANICEKKKFVELQIMNVSDIVFSTPEGQDIRNSNLFLM